ncbi:MAG: hypothetical protein ABI877_04200 [Gemmatimonadaceae bacterium]
MPDEDREHSISWGRAQDLIKAHRSTPSVAAVATEGVFGGAFKKKDVVKLLSQPDCAFLRIYYGRNDDGTPAMVLVGVDGDRNDMSAGVVLDTHFPCPPWCPSGGEKL